jgi:zinc protease
MQAMRGKRGLNYGDYAYIEKFIQDGWSTFPKPNIQRATAALRDLDPPGGASQRRSSRVRQALFETDRLVRDGIPEQGFEDTRQFLMNYRRLWVQDADRRLGYAVDGALVGRELVDELGKPPADDDARRRQPRHPQVPRHRRADRGHRDLGRRGGAGRGSPRARSRAPIVYDTPGTPGGRSWPKTAIIEVFPLGVSRGAHHDAVPASALFEK